MKKRLILASASPRRRELMNLAGYDFTVVTSSAEELSAGMSARELVMKNASLKANEVFSRNRDAVVVGADTVVALDGEILGKPKDEEDAKRMLKRLSGSEHEVLTGVSVVSEGSENCTVCVTAVKFRELTEAEIDAYIATGEPMDKAGAYGIQERASVFVEGIVGDFFNVVGLPVSALSKALTENNIFPTWHN